MSHSMKNAYVSDSSVVVNVDAPPSYEQSSSVAPPVPPRDDDNIIQSPREIPVVHAQKYFITSPGGFQPLEGLYHVPDNNMVVESERKKMPEHVRSALWGTLLVASGVDLAWSTFAFSYVLATWLSAVCLMLLPIVGIPLYFIFAISWRAMAHVDLIFSTSLYPTRRPLDPSVPFPPILFARLRDHIKDAPAPGSPGLAGLPAPVFDRADWNWNTVRLTMLAGSTWRAIAYFGFARFVLSLIVFCVFWCVIFPYWLIYGILCCGVFCTPGALVAPMVALMAPIPRMAVGMLSERSMK